jgi:hypothetical protein
MADEVSRLIAGKRSAPESDRADGGGPSAVSERNYLAAARIAQKLRDAGFGCEIVSLFQINFASLWAKRQTGREGE